MAKRLALIALGGMLSGCASADMVSFEVDSTPRGAQVEVDGISFGTTPTRVHLQCSRRWVGLAVAPGGWADDGAIYEITVLPPRGSGGISQRRRINPCQVTGGQGRINVDLNMDPITPRQRLDLRVNPSN